MSGGSYDYVGLIDDLEGFMEKRWTARSYLPDMAAALRARYAAGDVARDVESLLAYLEFVDRVVSDRLARVQPVLRALEWRDSCDWSDDQVVEAIETYRAKFLASPCTYGYTCGCHWFPGLRTPFEPPPRLCPEHSTPLVTP